MDQLLSVSIFVVTVVSILLFGHLARIRNGANRSNMVPEAAGSWPIIGQMYLLAGSEVPHKVFGSMVDKFGPIFTIKLGLQRVLVVNNCEMAKECLTTKDKVFASRPKAMVIELMGYNYGNFAFTRYRPYWREIRKIVVLELLSKHRVQTLAHVRVSEVNRSIIDIEQNGDEFKKAIIKFNELLGVLVPSDVIPGLRWLDLGGYENMMKKTAKKMDVIIDGWLEEHKKKMDYPQTIDESKHQVFMTTLLSRVKEEFIEDCYGFSTDTVVKATCVESFAATTDATTVTLTWALTLLVNNPIVLEKAQQELKNHVGTDSIVDESILKNLVYLQAIIKETMRLYPAAPLSLPHESIEDCTVGGYTVPKGTRLLVNIWKIQHDPHRWTNPFEFQPERFLTSNKEIDVNGQHF
ncbi:cytochrome P450 CYP82D47-like protein [Tanacetum coccineum]